MRVVIFFLILSCFVFPPSYYLAQSLDYGVWSWIIFSSLAVLAFSFPFIRKREAFTRLSFLAMGLLHFLFFTTMFRDLIYRFFHYSFNDLIVISSALLFLLAGLWWGRKPKIKKHTLHFNDLPIELDGITIAQVSDLHVGPSIKKEYVEYVTKLIQKVKPDFFVMTGDIGDSDPNIYAFEMDSFKEIVAPLGKFFVTGNHEYFWNASGWINAIKNVGVTPLLNDFKIITHKGKNILIGGVNDSIDRINPPDLSKANAEADFKIFLCHRPTPAPMAAKLGFHLQLSGHTHGGQFFPWTLLIRFFHKHHLGLSTEGKMLVYVNAGTGSWGPELRLHSTSEVTFLTLKSNN